MNPADERQCALSVCARLHVDPYKSAHFGGARDERFDVAFTGAFREIEAELGEFDGNVGFKAGGFQGVESPQIRLAAGGGFFEGPDILAEVVEGGRDAFRANFAADVERVFETMSGDKTRGKSPGRGRSFDKISQRLMSRQIQDQPAQRHIRIVGGRDEPSWRMRPALGEFHGRVRQRLHAQVWDS